jgi:hypothetical protein
MLFCLLDCQYSCNGVKNAFNNIIISIDVIKALNQLKNNNKIIVTHMFCTNISQITYGKHLLTARP